MAPRTPGPTWAARADWKIAGALAGRVHVLASGEIIAVVEPAKTGEQWRLINR